MEENEAMQKGFNAGYVLEKTAPALAMKIREGVIESEDPYIQGFLAGCKEYSVEQAKDKFKAKMRDNLKDRQEEKGKDWER